MCKQQLNQEMAMILGNIRKLEQMAMRLSENPICEKSLDELLRKSQRIALYCRNLWIHAEYKPPQESCPGVGVPGEGYYIEECGEATVTIILPLLLPKRGCPDAAFITEPLEWLLRQNRERMPRFKYCTVTFRHIYGPEFKQRDVRDHDNLESRAILNVLERYLLVSDSGIYCENVHITGRGDQTWTAITITGKQPEPERTW